MKLRKVSAPVQFALFLLLQLAIAGILFLVCKDRQYSLLENLADAGALLSWLALPLYLIYKFKPKGARRLQWQIPNGIGLVLAWIGYFMRVEAVQEQSWTLSNRGSIVELAGGFILLYGFVVLLRTPKEQR